MDNNIDCSVNNVKLKVLKENIILELSECKKRLKEMKLVFGLGILFAIITLIIIAKTIITSDYTFALLYIFLIVIHMYNIMTLYKRINDRKDCINQFNDLLLKINATIEEYNDIVE